MFRIRPLAVFVLALAVAFWRTSASAEPLLDSSRIVSIGGAVTEIVYALGHADKLVARDTTSVFPPEATRLPDIGYMRQLAPEGVLSVNPSAILAIEGSGPAETIAVLEKASVPFVLIPERFDRDGVLAKIRAVGAALGDEAGAAKLAASVAAEIDAAEKPLAAIATRKRILFVLSLQGGKIVAAGTGTAADGIIRLAGGVNAVSGYKGYKPLSDEEVIEAKPDIVLMMDRGGPSAPKPDEVFALPALAATPAGASKALIRMDGLSLLGFGPRTGQAMRSLTAALYPDVPKN